MKKVLIPLAPGCEELEAVTVIDLLRRANNEVVTASLAPGPVRAARKTVLVADTTLDQAQHNRYDIIVLPGGQPGTDNLNNDTRVIALVRKVVESGGYAAAICAAPKVLANAGLLKGKQFTAFPGAVSHTDAPGSTLIQDASVLQDGPIITSRGPGTAIDFALHLIGVLNGPAVRDQVEAALQRPSSHKQNVAD